jgi:hypothetical protein
MGDASGPRAQVLNYRTAPRELIVRRGDVVQVRDESIFDYLRDHLPGQPPAGPPLPFDFACGFVGYFGYELKRELDGTHAHDADTPDAMWILADRFLAFDHAEQQVWIVCLDEAVPSNENRRWMQTMRARLAGAPATAPDDSAAAARDLQPLAWRIDLAIYRELILRCQHEILQGETYEVCLTNQLVGEGRVHPLEIYRILRRHNPAPYAAYLRIGGYAVLCASPELFLHISSAGDVESKPIKGTAARGARPAAGTSDRADGWITSRTPANPATVASSRPPCQGSHRSAIAVAAIISGAVIMSVLTVASGASDRATTELRAVVISSPHRTPTIGRSAVRQPARVPRARARTKRVAKAPRTARTWPGGRLCAVSFTKTSLST